jgi:hypothetical protein
MRRLRVSPGIGLSLGLLAAFQLGLIAAHMAAAPDGRWAAWHVLSLLANAALLGVGLPPVLAALRAGGARATGASAHPAA